MIILHAAQSDVGLLLWGEAPFDAAASPSPSKGKKSTPRPSPCSVRAEALDALLQKRFPLAKAAALPIDAAAWLPSNGKAPLPSSHLLGDTEALTSHATLAPWLVPALLLEGEALLAILSVCWQKRTLTSGVVVGDDFAYWAEMLRFAGAVVAKQQFLPGIRTVGGELHAVWEPALDAGDQGRLGRFAKRMPHSARALADPSQKQSPSIPAQQVLRSFLAEAVDALVRSAITSERKFGRRSRQSLAPESVHDAWMAALRAPEGLIE